MNPSGDLLDAMLGGFEILEESTHAPGEQQLWYVGIDPGKSGYIVIVDLTARPRIVLAEPVPVFKDIKGVAGYNLKAVWELVQKLRVPHVVNVVLEKQQTYPKQGGVSNFTTGYSFGMWEMALTAAGIPYELVHPTTWKGPKGMGLRVKGASKDKNARTKEAKARAIAKAQALFPKHDFRPVDKPMARVPSSDHAEAALLALYAGRGRLVPT